MKRTLSFLLAMLLCLPLLTALAPMSAAAEAEEPVNEELNEMIGEAITFVGYQIRKEDTTGIRANYKLDMEAFAAAEEEGYTFKIGILSTSDDSKTLALIKSSTGKYTAPSKSTGVDNVTVYNSKYAQNGGFLKNAFYEGEEIHVVAEKENLAKTDYLKTFRYAAYVIAEKDGEQWVLYFSSASALGDGAMPYALANYYTYDREGAAGTKEGGFAMVNKFLTAVDGKYTQLPTWLSRIDEVSSMTYDETRMSYLNELFTYQCKAKRDPLLLEAMKHYEDENGTYNLYQKIDDCFFRYEGMHGVPIVDSLREIVEGGAAGSSDNVYLYVQTLQDPTTYTAGQKVEFMFEVRDLATDAIASAHHLSYRYAIDGVVDGSGKLITKTGTVAVTNGVAELIIPAAEIAASKLMNKDGTSRGIGIRMYVDICKADNSVYAINNGGAAGDDGKQHHGYIGAIIDFDNYELSYEEKPDFVQFWTEQMERLYATDIYDATPITPETRYDGAVQTQVVNGFDIRDNNYYHVTRTETSTHYRYDIYLKTPGPNSAAAIMTVPKSAVTQNRKLPITVSYQGYSPSAPWASAAGDRIMISVSHASYLIDGKDVQLTESEKKSLYRTKDNEDWVKKGILPYYTYLFRTALNGYAQGKTDRGSYAGVNSNYTDKADNYCLYMMMRDFNVIRFATETDEALIEKRVDTDGNPVYVPWNGDITVTGGSMGGYQAFFVTGMPYFIPEDATPINLTLSTPSIPGWGNNGAHQSEDVRIKNIFGTGYEENMGYFDFAVMAKYITCEVDITRVGLGDYTCPPYGAIVAYNRMTCKKKIRFHQNNDHNDHPDREYPSGIFVHSADAVSDGE